MKDMHTTATLLKEINRILHLEVMAMFEGRIDEENELRDLRCHLMIERAIMQDNKIK
jgi:hypothetical protein